MYPYPKWAMTKVMMEWGLILNLPVESRHLRCSHISYGVKLNGLGYGTIVRSFHCTACSIPLYTQCQTSNQGGTSILQSSRSFCPPCQSNLTNQVRGEEEEKSLGARRTVVGDTSWIDGTSGIAIISICGKGISLYLSLLSLW